MMNEHLRILWSVTKCQQKDSIWEVIETKYETGHLAQTEGPCT